MEKWNNALQIDKELREAADEYYSENLEELKIKAEKYVLRKEIVRLINNQSPDWKQVDKITLQLDSLLKPEKLARSHPNMKSILIQILLRSS